MKNIFYIAYEFPPLNVAGSHRSLKIINNIQNFGINPIVFTVNIDSIKNKDFSLKIKESVKIVRVNVDESKMKKIHDHYYFNIIDSHAKAWKEDLIKKILIYYKIYKPYAMVVSVPPFSIGLLSMEISKKLKIPLIVDFRDLWTQWVMTPFSTFFHYWLTLRIEKKIINASNAIIVVTDKMIDNFNRVHKNIQNDKIYVIRNSYDGKINNNNIIINKNRDFNEKPLNIVYVGSFYFNPESHKLIYEKWYKKKPYQYLQYIPRYENWLYRTPFYFFKAIKFLVNRNNKYFRQIKIIFAGKKELWLEKMIYDFGIKDMVNMIGYVSHSDIEKIILYSDITLATSVKVENGEDYCIACKTYEYFKYIKPILAFVTQGAQMDIIKKSGLGIICDPDNYEGSAEQIKKFMEGNILLNPDVDFIRSLSAEESARKFSDIINKIS